MHTNWDVMMWILANYGSKGTAPPPAPSPAKPTPTQAVELEVASMGVGKSNLNPLAIKICFSLWVVLALISTTRKRLRPTSARKKSWASRAWLMAANTAPFLAIVIGAAVCYQIKKSDGFDNWSFDTTTGLVVDNTHDYYKYNLRLVGVVPSGLNIARSSSTNSWKLKRDFGTLLARAFPTSFIGFLEGYSVARKLAMMGQGVAAQESIQTNQELWAIGLSNLLGSLALGMPVTGSFSRSSVNRSAGARTPLSGIVTLLVVLVCLAWFADQLYYVPQAALAAVIMSAISGLIDIRAFWDAWKYNRRDFLVMLLTALVTFFVDTQWGVVLGIAMSLLSYDFELAYSSYTAPRLVLNPKLDEQCIVEVASLESYLVFFTCSRLKEMVKDVLQQYAAMAAASPTRVPRALPRGDDIPAPLGSSSAVLSGLWAQARRLTLQPPKSEETPSSEAVDDEAWANDIAHIALTSIKSPPILSLH